MINAILPKTISSAAKYMTPCLFSATHWYMPASDNVNTDTDRTPSSTWILSCEKQDEQSHHCFRLEGGKLCPVNCKLVWSHCRCDQISFLFSKSDPVYFLTLLSCCFSHCQLCSNTSKYVTATKLASFQWSLNASCVSNILDETSELYMFQLSVN